MMIGRIEGCTRELGKPPDWDEATQGACATLPVRDVIDGTGAPLMLSAWFPEVFDLARLVGGSLFVRTLGTHLWFVGLSIGEPFGLRPMTPLCERAPADMPYRVWAYDPSHEDLAWLTGGAAVCLAIVGQVHPVVSVWAEGPTVAGSA